MAPRRGADEYDGPSTSSRAGKKARFNDGSDDEDIMIDDEADLETKKPRKDAPKGLGGYDSDSSDDGEGVVPSRKGTTTTGDDDDDDMFSSAPSKPPPPSSSKNKDKKYLKLGDIEGQEFSKADDSGGEDSDDSKDGMGYTLSSFNMKSELKEGKFEEDGSYVVGAKDPNEVHDAWLEGVDSKKEIRKAREAKRKADEREREMEQRAGEKEMSKDEIVRELVDLMNEGETVLETMQRLGGTVGGGGGKKKSWAERQKERKQQQQQQESSSAMEVDPKGKSKASATGASPASPFDRLSTLSSLLTSMGQLDIYSQTRSALQRQIPKSAAPPQQQPKKEEGNIMFEYRFSMEHIRALPPADRPLEREIFGPFPKADILAWRAQGFFGGIGGEPEKVELRKILNGSGDTWGGFWETVS